MNRPCAEVEMIADAADGAVPLRGKSLGPIYRAQALSTEAGHRFEIIDATWVGPDKFLVAGDRKHSRCNRRTGIATC